MSYPKHEDHRGYFQELFKAPGGINIRQVSKFSINPGKIRGNHFHKETWEIFIIEKGSVDFTIENVDTKVSEKVSVKEGETVVMSPYMNHELYSENGCEIIVLSSRMFNPDDPDTFTR